MTRRTRGLTLIELVAAMAIFALVAVMGAQALSGMIRMRDDLVSRSTRAADLERAVSLLRADLAAVVPMQFYPPGGAAPQLAVLQTGNGIAISVAGQPGLDPTEARPMQRVEYRLTRDGRLTRQVWPTLYPARAGMQSPEQIVLDGVSAVKLRSFWPLIGWQDGVRPPASIVAVQPETTADSDRATGAPEVYSSLLPDAVEVALEVETLGRVPILETLR